MEKDYYEALDAILDFIYEENANGIFDNGNPDEKIINKLGGKDNFSNFEWRAMYRYLESEKYLGGEFGGLSLKGYLFIQDGKYREKNNQERLRIKNEERVLSESIRNSRILSWGTVALVIVELLIHWEKLKCFFYSP